MFGLLALPLVYPTFVNKKLSRSQGDMRDVKRMTNELYSRNASQLAQRVLCMTHNVLPIYTALLEQYPIYIAALDQLSKSNQEFRTAIRLMISFEIFEYLHKSCCNKSRKAHARALFSLETKGGVRRMNSVSHKTCLNVYTLHNPSLIATCASINMLYRLLNSA